MVKKKEFKQNQKQILEQSENILQFTSEAELLAIATGEVAPQLLSEEKLLEFLTVANLLYRAGEQLIDDNAYDFIFLAELGRRSPEHPFLNQVEPEPVVAAKTVELPVRMLSTEKAYKLEEMDRWAKRIDKAAGECGLVFEDLEFRGTPKLDGFAAYDDGTRLYTRGDGRKGTDISRAFERGLQVAGSGKRGLGPGEIVVSRSYFNSHLSEYFDNSRNFQASLIKEKELEEPARKAIENKEAVFYPFSELPFWHGRWEELRRDFDRVVDELWPKVDYDVDGIVFEVTDPTIKEHMGATRHHHRWQIAFKRNTETATVKVLQVVAQTSRSGRVNPVAEIEPTRLSGAMIRRATAHHYAMVKEKGIGAGAVIQLSRSGEVIPKIEDVVQPAVSQLPEVCPSCNSDLVWEGDYLRCLNNLQCPAQITHSIEHFFKVLGNIDGFGPSSIRKLFDGGITTIPQIYSLKEADFETFGFGPKQAENMVAQLRRSLEEPIEDWRFLAAFGIHRLGMGNSEKLLSAYPIDQLFGLEKEQIVEIDGFSDKIAAEILLGLDKISQLFKEMYQLGFSLIQTELVSKEADGGEGVLAGLLVVFTGTMVSGSRKDMEANAKSLGAKVAKSVTGKTDILVCGAKVGAKKISDAESIGVKILSEEQYLANIERQ